MERKRKIALPSSPNLEPLHSDKEVLHVALESRLDKETHPLSSDVLLPMIITNFSFQDLKSVRLVCKQWRDSTIKLWRQQAVLVLRDREEYPLNKVRELYQRSLTVETFKAMHEKAHSEENADHVVDSFFDPPFQNYLLVNWRYDKIEPVKSYKNYFWTNCGSWVRQLTIDSWVFKDLQGLETILYEKTPNLEQLMFIGTQDFFKALSSCLLRKYSSNADVGDVKEQINFKCLKLPATATSFPMNWCKFFRHFPNLEKIILSKREAPVYPDPDDDCISSFLVPSLPYDYYGSDKMFQAVLDVRQKDPNKLLIKYLDIYELDMYSVLANHFHNLALPLETLKTSVEYGLDSDELLNKILTSVAKTIKTLFLSLTIQCNSNQNVTAFPSGLVMNSLEDLRLSGPISRDFGFLQCTPNLKHLRIYNKYVENLRVLRIEDDDEVIEEESESSPNPLEESVMNLVNLEYLHELHLNYPIRDATGVKALAKSVPNVIIMNLHIVAICFPEVCEQWKDTKLRELDLHSDNLITDEMITGKTEAENGTIERLEDTRNIEDLKELEVFRLHMRRRTDCFKCSHLPPRVTGFSIRHGLILLPKLRSLQLATSQGISNSSLQLLEKKGVKVEGITAGTCGCGVHETEHKLIQVYKLE